MFAGYKTYIVAGLTAIGALASYLMGETSIQDAIQLAVTAILASTIRHGVSTGA